MTSISKKVAKCFEISEVTMENSILPYVALAPMLILFLFALRNPDVQAFMALGLFLLGMVMIAWAFYWGVFTIVGVI